MPKHKNCNPNRQKPPTVPPHARTKHVEDIWAWTAFLRLYLQYVLAKKHHHRPPYDWIILGGQFLKDINHMSEILLFEQEVHIQLEKCAESLCCELQEGESGTIEGGGNRLITSDLSSTHVALSLGRFYVWYEAKGTVGPKRGNSCPYKIDIEWTLKDDYDFDLWKRNWFTKFISAVFQFYRYFGNEYRVIGTWKSKTSGNVNCQSNSTTTTTTTTTTTPNITDCTKKFPQEGHSRIYSNYMATRDAAVSNAKSLLQDRAQVEAGLKFNGFQCPQDTLCNKKHLENLTFTIEDIDVSWSLIVSIFSGGWRYQALIKFKWHAQFVCRSS